MTAAADTGICPPTSNRSQIYVENHVMCPHPKALQRETGQETKTVNVLNREPEWRRQM
jgi:hypothetical protein